MTPLVSFPKIRIALSHLRDPLQLLEAYKVGLRRWTVPTIELSLIGLWVMLLGGEYLALSPKLVPAGREFLSAIQTHHLWTNFIECGTCALWNGSVRGGYPAFVDPHGSMLHPIVIATTYLWGVINGAKIALLVSLWIAGAAQWWTARILKLGWIPRMWSALLVVAGGHLAGRMELGAFGVVLSMAMVSLVFPPLLGLAIHGGRRYALLLGVAAASAIVAGQGYMQFGLLATLPAFAFLLLTSSFRLRPVWRNYVFAAVLAVLLAAPFLVPLAHFYPNFGKAEDAAYKVAQPLEYVPLNLVINDQDFYRTEALGKQPLPHLYMMYIGWVPVILAILGVALARRADRWWISFLAAAIAIEFLVASGAVLKAGQEFASLLAGIRHPPQIAGVAVPLIVTLAGYGLDRLLKRNWPTVQIKFPNQPDVGRRVFSLSWIMVIPLVLSLNSAFSFSRDWLYLNPLPDEVYDLLRGLKTDDLQWVQPPFGEHQYIEPAISMDLKLSPGIMTWFWKHIEWPSPILEANRAGEPEGAVGIVDEIDGIPIYEHSALPYAYVTHGSSVTPCTATGTGGHLTVECETTEDGQLIVQENMWSGWRAWRDGRRVQLIDPEHLVVPAPAGNHTYSFRYVPWDVPLGIGLMGVGLVAGAWVLLTKEETVQNASRAQGANDES